MKKIVFIDDEPGMLEVQGNEMREILRDNPDVVVENICCNMRDVKDCLDDSGRKKETTDAKYYVVFSVMDDIITRLIEDVMNYDQTEVVIDLCLGSGNNPILGYRLAKFILSNSINETAFKEQRLLITATSSFYSFDNQIGRSILSDDEKNKIVFCYRPLFSDKKRNYFFDKGIQNFPIFYKQYHCRVAGVQDKINKLLLDEENVPGQVGTAYGNYFGLVYARLYQNSGV